MTQRSYYTDAYTTRFQADLIAVTTHDGRPALALDHTYFYPTSGGQPHDTGTLADATVVDVVAGDDGTVYHVLDALPDPAPSRGPVTGELDWPRRHDHMQQHSGQHLLSQVCYRLLGVETVSVHFGERESTLDVDAATLAPEQLAQVEAAANDLVFAALPITAYSVDERDLARVPLRRPPKVSGTIRIVEIQGYDYSACGGTHVRTTAEIGPIKLVRQERRRSQTRLTFLCGGRAVADYQRKHDLLTQAAAVYSTDMAAVPDLLARGQEQIKELQRQLTDLNAKLLGYEVASLREQAAAVGPWHVLCLRRDDQAADALKMLATLLQEDASVIALLATTAGGKTTAIFARGAAVTLHMGNLLRDALKAFGGGGGGRPEYAQGGGIAPAQVDDLLAFARAAVSQAAAAQAPG